MESFKDIFYQELVTIYNVTHLLRKNKVYTTEVLKDELNERPKNSILTLFIIKNLIFILSMLLLNLNKISLILLFYQYRPIKLLKLLVC